MRWKARPASRALVAILILGAAPVARAQKVSTPEGAFELLLPSGARSVGMGQAVVADETGSEGLWWNPAAVARLARAEGAVHHAQTFGFTADLLAAVVPRQPFGVFSLAANLVNLGEQEVTDEVTGVTGTFQIRSTIVAAGYATSFGKRLNAGLTYKVLHVDFAGTTANTSAVDVGAQGRHAIGGGELAVGAALRNMGLKLQYKDEQQADPLPTRLDVGASYARALDQVAPGLAARAAVGVVTGPRTSSLGLRIGGEVAWQSRYFARAGYAKDAPAVSGPSLGLGLHSGRFTVDIGRVFDEFSTQAGTPPTFLSLRVHF